MSLKSASGGGVSGRGQYFQVTAVRPTRRLRGSFDEDSADAVTPLIGVD
jgi:hypothetical protein